MTTKRSYTASEVAELIDLLRLSGDIPDAEIAGMQRLGQLLTRFEGMSDLDIEAMAKTYFRSVKKEGTCFLSRSRWGRGVTS